MPSMHSQRIKQEQKLTDSEVKSESRSSSPTTFEHHHGTKRLRDFSHHQPTPKRAKLDEKFVCPAPGCGASYTRRHNLKTHFKTCHQDVEHLFPEVFQTLKSTKEGKEFKCPVETCICGYSRKGDLKFHFMRKHPELLHLHPDICKSKSSKSNKKYVCPITECKCGYMRKSDLRSHFQTKHHEMVDQYPEFAASSHLSEGTDTESFEENTYVPSPDRKPSSSLHHPHSRFSSLAAVVKKEKEDEDVPSKKNSFAADEAVAADSLYVLSTPEELREEYEAAAALQSLALKSPSREPSHFNGALPPLCNLFTGQNTLNKNAVNYFCAPNKFVA